MEAIKCSNSMADSTTKINLKKSKSRFCSSLLGAQVQSRFEKLRYHILCSTATS